MNCRNDLEITYNFYFIPVDIVRQRFPYPESQEPSGRSQAFKIIKTYSWEVVGSNLGWDIGHHDRSFRQVPGYYIN
jgi:hypothetical protein